MGGGIAMCFANVGIPVVLLEINDEPFKREDGDYPKNYTITVKKGNSPKIRWRNVSL
ncbi:MAG: hypothetical protein CM1200mP40_24300 [Gammaproteobacteria bacterium]|nr:MAG: hypothetical protein CM1200mP40_24300 [Gammaproteobacteria bacterium]